MYTYPFGRLAGWSHARDDEHVHQQQWELQIESALPRLRRVHHGTEQLLEQGAFQPLSGCHARIGDVRLQPAYAGAALARSRDPLLVAPKCGNGLGESLCRWQFGPLREASA